jgi:hypothetical protein
VQALCAGVKPRQHRRLRGLSLLLSTAYLRTRALWLSWGINFGWKASRALLFGLAISGDNSHSPVVQGNPMGPFWLTGGGYGLDGSWVAFILLLAALPVVYRLTRDLDYRWNAPVIVPAGIPVDLDAPPPQRASTRPRWARLRLPRPAWFRFCRLRRHRRRVQSRPRWNSNYSGSTFLLPLSSSMRISTTAQSAAWLSSTG